MPFDMVELIERRRAFLHEFVHMLHSENNFTCCIAKDGEDALLFDVLSSKTVALC